MDEERSSALIHESLAAAVKTKATRIEEFRQAVAGSTVQE
jgi:hypothetical protein